MNTAKGTLKHNNWKEEAYFEARPQRATTVTTDVVFDGSFEGTAKTTWLMHYTDDKHAHYAGHVLFEGSADGQRGSFALYEVGAYKNGVADSHWQVLEGSGTGAFKGMKGKGGYRADQDNTVRYDLKYELP